MIGVSIIHLSDFPVTWGNRLDSSPAIADLGVPWTVIIAEQAIGRILMDRRTVRGCEIWEGMEASLMRACGGTFLRLKLAGRNAVYVSFQNSFTNVEKNTQAFNSRIEEYNIIL